MISVRFWTAGVLGVRILGPIHLIILVIHEVQKAILIAQPDVMKNTGNNDYFRNIIDFVYINVL